MKIMIFETAKALNFAQAIGLSFRLSFVILVGIEQHLRQA